MLNEYGKMIFLVPVRLELTTFALLAQYSNQLSYGTTHIFIFELSLNNFYCGNIIL